MKFSYATHCAAKARLMVTNGEGLSITACPLNENEADNDFVEIFKHV